jgi:hypothetical protein
MYFYFDKVMINNIYFDQSGCLVYLQSDIFLVHFSCHKNDLYFKSFLSTC